MLLNFFKKHNHPIELQDLILFDLKKLSQKFIDKIIIIGSIGSLMRAYPPERASRIKNAIQGIVFKSTHIFSAAIIFVENLKKHKQIETMLKIRPISKIK